MIAGTLDITAAIITTLVREGKPARMLQSIAQRGARCALLRGGLKTSALGRLLHFVIAIGATAVYYLTSRRLTFLVRQPVISGVLYGIAVYFFMQLIVFPLSAVPFRASFRPSQLAIGLIVHILCVGLPIALVVRRVSTTTR